MVERLIRSAMMCVVVSIAVTCWCALATAATIEEADAHLASYKAAIAQQQGALAQQDMATYERLEKEIAVMLKEARLAFDAADAGDSSDATVIERYAEVLHLMGDDDLGAEMIEAARARQVENAVLWRLAGEMRLAMGAGHYQAGVNALRKSIEMDGTSPDAANAWFALGKHYLLNEMPGDAARSFAAALAVDAAHVPSQLGQAAANVYTGDVAAAGATLESVGRAAQPYDVMLRAMIRTALSDFDRTRRTFADTAENHYAYARLLYISTRLPEAVLAAKRASRLAKDRVDIMNFLGAVQIQLGDYPGAIATYEASLAVNPDQAPIQQTLEGLRQAQEEAEKAQQPAQGRGPLR